MIDQVLLESSRLIIREYTPDDLNAIHAYARDESVVRFMVWGPNSLDDTKKFLAEAIEKRKQNPRTSYELCIETKSNNQLIGGCGIYIKDSDRLRAEIGYILHKEFWGQGFVTEATKLLVAYARKELGIEVIEATCDLKNIGSQRVLEKSGFKLLKTFENHFEQKGVMRTSLLFQYESH